MSNAGNVCRHFHPVGQSHARHFAQSRIWLLRRLSIHANANAALLRAGLKRRTRSLVARGLPAFANQLVKRRQPEPLKLSRHASNKNSTKDAWVLRRQNLRPIPLGTSSNWRAK